MCFVEVFACQRSGGQVDSSPSAIMENIVFFFFVLSRGPRCQLSFCNYFFLLKDGRLSSVAGVDPPGRSILASTKQLIQDLCLRLF